MEIRILVVDDNDDFRNIAKTFLERADSCFKIDTTSDARDAIIELQNNEYDAIVSDYQMPVMDGLELLEAIRSMGNDIPFVMFTGRSREEVAIKALNLGATQYVKKGGDFKSQFTELAHIVKSAVEHRRASIALSESERRYRLLAENVTDVIFTINLDLEMTFVSPSVEKAIGWKPEEIQGKSARHIIELLDFTITIQELEEIIVQELQEQDTIENLGPLQFQIKHKNGNRITIEMKTSALTSQEGRTIGIIGTARDITKRVETSEAAKKSAEQYVKLLEAIHDAVFVLDREYRIILTNHASTRSTDVPQEQLIGKKITDIFPQLENTVFLQTYNKVMNTRQKESVLGPFHFEDGKYGWYQIDVYPTDEGILCISRDVTERETSKKEIERKIEIEQLINRMLSSFFTEDVIDKAITHSIEEIGKTFDASYCAVRVWDNTELPIQKFYLWSKDNNLNIHEAPAIQDYSWLVNQIKLHNILIIENIGEIPDTRAEEKAFFEALNIQSVIAMPLFLSGESSSVIGLGFSETSPHSIENELNLIELVVQTFSEALERRAIQELLEIQKEKYKLLADNSSDIIILADKDLRIEFISPSVEKMLGVSPQDILNKPLTLLIHPRMQKATKRKIEQLYLDNQESDAYHFEIQMMTDTDQEKWGEIAISVLNPHTQDFRIVGEIRDITERRIAEEELRKSEERYRSLIQGFQGIAYRSTPLGEFYFIHGDVEGLTGRKQSEFLTGKIRFLDMVHPDDRDRVKEIGRKCSRIPGYKSKREYRIVSPEGYIRWVQESISNICNESWEVTQIEGVLIDITMTKLAQESLRESEQVLRDLFHSIPDPAFLWRKDENIVYTTLANKAACDLLQMDDIKGMGMRVEELHKYNPEIIELIYKAFDEGVSIRKECATQFSGDGKKIWSMLALSQTADGSVLEILTDLSDQRDTEIALRESERKYRSFVQDFYGIAYRLDIDLKPIFVHGAVEELTGYSAEEIFDISNILHPLVIEDDAIRVAEFWSNILNTSEPQSITYRIRRKDESIRWTEHRVHVIRENDGTPKYIQGTTIDVTEKVKAENELRESEERHRTIINSMHDMILVYDKENRFVQFYCSENSPLYGRPELFIGENSGVTFPTTKNGEAISLVERVRKTGKSHIIDFPMSIDGVKYWFSAQLSLHEDGESIVSVVRDMTRRKKIEEALRDNEEKFRRLFQEIPEPSTLWELQSDGSIILAMVNSSFLEKSNGRISKFIGTPIEEVYDFYPAYCDAIKEVMQTGLPKTLELPLHFENDDNGWFICEFAKTSDNLVLVISTDLTDILEIQKKLTIQKEELSRFAHHMSHDLRNYLHNILGYAVLLEDEYNPEHIKGIVSSVNKAEKLLSKSVDLADAGFIIGTREEVHLKMIMDSIIEAIVPDSITLEMESLPIVVCDPVKVEQALSNILSNAIDHGNPNEITITTRQSNDGIAILIKNDGIPIPQEYRDLILREGFSTREEGGGLGLAIVQKVFDAHGWEIRLEDTQQTCFKISIPKEDLVEF
ncbi:MAG: PAS domain S-box protein [Candidatus Lokiarchaeota archaeon]|nr:PAS domain S-box protein [Candidatus Lokiarchaeota archaeon]